MRSFKTSSLFFLPLPYTEQFLICIFLFPIMWWRVKRIIVYLSEFVLSKDETMEDLFLLPGSWCFPLTNLSVTPLVNRWVNFSMEERSFLNLRANFNICRLIFLLQRLITNIYRFMSVRWMPLPKTSVCHLLALRISTI